MGITDLWTSPSLSSIEFLPRIHFFSFFFFYVNVIVYDLVYIYRIIAIVAIS